MNEQQSRWSTQQFGAWVADLDADITSIPAQDVWLAAMEHAWMGDPLTLGNLQAKVAELEERLRNLGGQHAEQLRELQVINGRQAGLLRERDERLRDEQQTWRLTEEAMKIALDNLRAEHEAEMEEQIQQEREATQAQCERTYRIELQKVIENERAHFNALKETILAGQRIVMLDEFNRQYHQLEESWSRRLDEANKRLAPGSPDLLAVNTRWDEYVHDLRGRLQTEFHEEMEKLEVENRELRQKVERMEQSAVQQITDFTDRFLADDEYRRGVLEDAINTRIDQGVIILKGMVALELRRKPDRADSSLILPSEEDFDAWWNGIHWSAGPDLLDWDALARRAWEEALSRVKLS